MKITVTKNKKEISIEINKPNQKDIVAARSFSGGVFAKVLKNPDIITRDQLNKYLLDKGLWTDEDQKNLEKISEEISKGERQLARGGKDEKGKKFSKEKAKKLALEMRIKRMEQLILIAKLKKYDHLTLEGQTDNANFDFLVSRCASLNNKPLFKNYDEYIEDSQEDYAVKIAETLAEMMYGSYEDIEKEQSENKFLVKYEFVNEDLKLVNVEGKLIDESGKLVDDEGRYIDDKGNFIDSNGDSVDEDGNPIEEFTPFE